MYILGFSAYYHDSAACLLHNGDIVAAAQEERFTTDDFHMTPEGHKLLSKEIAQILKDKIQKNNKFINKIN